MSRSVSTLKARDVANFEPRQTREEVAKADALIELARDLKNWPLLETAVEHKIDEQAEFVRWWRENVSKNHGGARNQVPSSAHLNFAQAEDLTSITHQQVSKWANGLKDREKYQAALYGAAYRKAMAEHGQTAQRGASGTGENEWYTPPEYIALARKVLGEIDLDPASSAAAQEKVRARTYFTEEENGLSHEWHGRIWLNPPYAQPHIANFVSKMAAERRASRVTAAVMLTHNYTDTSWFHEAAAVADAICFTRGRVRFYGPNGEVAAPTQGQAFFYFGEDVEAFVAHFAGTGFIVQPYVGEVIDAG